MIYTMKLDTRIEYELPDGSRVTVADIEALRSPSLDQAKQICEQAGFAVVPRNPASGGWNEAAKEVK